jgi:hypothetical protein
VAQSFFLFPAHCVAFHIFLHPFKDFWLWSSN